MSWKTAPCWLRSTTRTGHRSPYPAGSTSFGTSLMTRSGPAPNSPGRHGSGWVVACAAQHLAQVRHHLVIDVLAVGWVEEFPGRTDRHGDLAVVAYGDCSDGLQQRQHRPPFDVMTNRVPEDLAQRIAVPVVQMLWLR